ncbi:M64 family metallopeptidase [Pseudonocardia acaciae]|uniref:M64 family metallopeptidase n=1 Tax=Pseudonocardia acaciae TaxID=551276 RepID=UPI00048A807B|nr:M64 family metallopeptidase [Pseudonocardia acaciae]
MVSDLLLFPHCDLHMALSGTPPLQLRVFERTDPPNPGPYVLTEVPSTGYAFDFFAPNRDPGHRLDEPLPKISSGFVSATEPGVYLFQLRVGTKYLVGRLQVHEEVKEWWFGNDSITTAKDPLIAHAQPSIYARFSQSPRDVAAGTDLVGDITNHGYVTLTSTDISKVTVSSRDRLRGVVATDNPVLVEGTFLNDIKRLPVRVVDYDVERVNLYPIQISDVTNVDEMHNIVVLPEGFRPEDRARLLDLTTRITQEMFDKPRHQPFGMLRSRFNVFLSYADSQQHAITCGFRVADHGVGTHELKDPGAPIPYNGKVNNSTKGIYRMSELVSRVGLPRRGENRSNQVLKDLWSRQDLTDLEMSRVDDELIDAWKAHQADGILHARDTYFGIIRGGRLADRRSGVSPVDRPANDNPGTANRTKFIARLYEFYTVAPSRSLAPDPRRHPPELYAGFLGPTDSILRYVGGLKYLRKSEFLPIGKVWIPDDKQYKPSRGLIVVLANDDFGGGTNETITAMSAVNRKRTVAFAYGEGNRKMWRDPPAVIAADVGAATDTLTHELAHSFNLDDEYEVSRGDDPGAKLSTADLTTDNAAALGFIRFGAAPGRAIDPAKVKWFALPRMRLSARLLEPSKDAAPATGIQVSVGTQEIGNWAKAKADSAEVQVHLRNFKPGPLGAQLLPAASLTPYLKNLRIGQIDATRGTLVLAGPGLPARPYPVFTKGSALFIPVDGGSGSVETVVQREVLAHLATTHKPLNLEPDTTEANPDADYPEPIGGLFSPCLPRNLVGIFEGAATFAGGYYRPAGDCKMRSNRPPSEGQFCYVCMWLIVNRIDPTFHAELNRRFYPGQEND